MSSSSQLTERRSSPPRKRVDALAGDTPVRIVEASACSQEFPPRMRPLRSARNEERTRWIRAVDDAAAPTRNSATGPCPLRSPSPTATWARAPGDGLCCDHVVQHRTVVGRRGGDAQKERPPPRVTRAVWPWAVAAHSCPKWQPFVLRTRVELSREALVCLPWPSATWVPDRGPEMSRTCNSDPLSRTDRGVSRDRRRGLLL